MKSRLPYFVKRLWLIGLGATILTAGSACHRNDCPAHHGGYIDNHKFVSKQKHKKPKSGLYPKGEKLHGF